mmetsp:Transcript_10823/g.16113  ORF Transcript_10823/g.16113 Transcript_10823/m.16113 type:complete len:403 (+) Transcript_10823:58-1266(+)
MPRILVSTSDPSDNNDATRPSTSIATQRLSEVPSTDARVTNLADDRFPLNARETNHSSSSSSSSDADEDDNEEDDGAFVRLDFNVDNTTDTDPYYSSMYSNRQTLHHTTSPSNTVMWIMYFFLLRLWLEALMERDTGLMLFCLMVTALATRAAQRRREMEEEMARQRAERGELALPIGLQHMSFRAQLAHAMLESQRMQMMAQANGGIHSPESNTNNGVSEEIQRTWKRWTYGSGGGGKAQQSEDNTNNHNEDDGNNNSNALSTPSRIQRAIMRLGSVGGGSSGYGTVSRMDLHQQEEGGNVKDSNEEEEDLELGQNCNADAEYDVTCSICLCEYEEGDEVTMLPCNHMYHEACVKEWTGQSQRCPLCNYDLMSMQESSARSASANNSASLEAAPASVVVSI